MCSLLSMLTVKFELVVKGGCEKRYSYISSQPFLVLACLYFDEIRM